MKNFLDTLSGLSTALCEFLQKADSAQLLERAIEDNPWFSAQEILLSIEAICSQMLRGDLLEKWISAYPQLPHHTAKRVAIIMAGNIPLVGFSDLLCTLAAGHQAWVKPSSKDRVLMEYICKLLKEIDRDIPIYRYEKGESYDAVIATGGNEANLYFESAFSGVKRLCRNSRHSIAVLSSETTDEQLQLLAEDIYLYSGLGCRNVSMIFSPRGMDIKLPNFKTGKKYRNNYLQSRALMSMCGKEFIDNGCSLITHSDTPPHSLSSISLFEYDCLQEVEKWIEKHDEQLQCIVSNIITHPRCVDFGQAQHPTLFDYADGVDTMKFLEFND